MARSHQVAPTLHLLRCFSLEAARIVRLLTSSLLVVVPLPFSSHLLESNQNLSGFSRARRPTTQKWDVSAARAAELLGEHDRSRSAIFIVINSSVVIEHPRALGAPRASMQLRVLGHARAHLSRFHI